jgi:hypothetical protein
MAEEFVRTTQQRTVDDRGRPVETMQEREVVRTLREPEGLNVYDPGSTLPEYYLPSEPAVSASNGVAAVGSRLRAQESWRRQQSAFLRDIDYRLAHLEEANHAWAARQSVEQATWWALWGILMLILGSALAVIVILIFLPLVH